MSELLLNHFRSRTSISDEEFRMLFSNLEKRQVKKKEPLLKQGEICNYSYFVNTGLLYSYSMDENGMERVVHFAPEDYWIGDLYSFLKHTPTTVTIMALEDSEVYMLHTDVLERMLTEIPGLERYYRILYQNAYTSTQHRLDCTLNVSASERYMKILTDNPKLLQRIPLHLIASYLGITAESLSRIRRKLMTKTKI